jgi:hypothetical protein
VCKHISTDCVEKMFENAKHLLLNRTEFDNNQLSKQIESIPGPWSNFFSPNIFIQYIENSMFLVCKTNLACGLPETHHMAVLHDTNNVVEWINDCKVDEIVIQVCVCVE